MNNQKRDHNCSAVTVEDCKYAESLRRRHEDPIIDAIHARLDTLENLSKDMSEIKEWISMVVKVSKLMEWCIDTVTAISIICAKMALAYGALWLSLRLSMNDVTDSVRALFRGGK